ncbi:hypothetical protein F2Q69_00023640 [Brassica cretica]|uniref:Uncharacterized protein n=1 Tax=Brassica cretica TaxID=69181 RepID=A0A8S9Q8B4_BRACR|nr:hypothetical protein F2Q69_00023640 [Brassica cretica]
MTKKIIKSVTQDDLVSWRPNILLLADTLSLIVRSSICLMKLLEFLRCLVVLQRRWEIFTHGMIKNASLGWFDRVLNKCEPRLHGYVTSLTSRVPETLPRRGWLGNVQETFPKRFGDDGDS